MKKLLSVVVVLAMMLSIGAVQVFAEEIAYAEKGANEIIATFDDMSKDTLTTWDAKAGVKADKTFKDGNLVIPSNEGGNIEGFKVTGVPAGTYKAAYYFNIESIKDASNPPEGEAGMQDWRTRLNPIINGNGMYLNLPYYDCTFDNIDFTGLANVSGKKIIAIAVINVVDDDSTVELWGNVFNGPDGSAEYITGSLDKIVLAGAEYNFGQDSEYEVFIEQAPHEGDANYKAIEGDWEPSEEVEDDNTATTPDNDKKDDDKKDDDKKDDDKKDDATTTPNTNTGKEETPKTADVSVVLAMVAAGAAAFGGLKLRKK